MAPGRRSPRWPWVLAALLVLAGIGAALRALPGTGVGDSPGRTIAISRVATLDPPPGDGTENDGDLDRVVDGDDETAWSTERYGSPEPTDGRGQPKGGVGLAVVLDERADLRRVDVGTPAGGWSAQVHVVEADGELPTDLAGWGDPVAEVDDVDAGTVRIEVDRVAGDAVLIWFTRLPPVGEGRHAAQVSDIGVRGS